MNRKEYNQQMKDLYLLDEDEIYAEAKRRIKECRKNKSKKLDFSALNLKEIPPEIAELENLTELDIRRYGLKVPASVGNLVNLKKLLVGNHSILSEGEELVLPPELGNLRNLTYLSLGYDIHKIPGWVWDLENLDTLIILNDEIETIPAEIAGLKKLRDLRLYGENITCLPSEIGELPLIVLDLKCPKLDALPKSFANLKKMQGFRFERSNLKTIPELICDWTELKLLEISMENTFEGPSTALKGIPKNIGNLKKLRELELFGTSITKIPDSLGDCPLKHLKLIGNFKTIPLSFGNLVKMETLKLSSKKPITLPDTFGNLSALKELEISAPVMEIPASFGRLAVLEKLSLVAKNLVLPKTIGGLCALKELLLGASEMKTIPNSIGNCKNLKLLTIDSDKLTSLPQSFCNLKNIEELRLVTFALKTLPVKFGSLASLKSLSILSGAMTTLPESMVNLKKLKSFWLDAYNIKKLPDWFDKLHFIKEKNIEIGKEDDTGAKKKLICFEDLAGMSSSYRYKLLDSYSLKEVESVLCSAPEYYSDSRINRGIFRDLMLIRRWKLNSKFKWTDENKKRIAKVSEAFTKAWEDVFAKAKVFIDALYEKEPNKDKDAFSDKYRIELILYPEIVISKEDGIYSEYKYDLITGSYLKKEVSMKISSDPDKCEDDFRRNIHIKRELSWNIEGLGDLALEDYYICYALHILYVHNEWALEDIAKINSISSEIQVYCDGKEF